MSDPSVRGMTEIAWAYEAAALDLRDEAKAREYEAFADLLTDKLATMLIAVFGFYVMRPGLQMVTADGKPIRGPSPDAGRPVRELAVPGIELFGNPQLRQHVTEQMVRLRGRGYDTATEDFANKLARGDMDAVIGDQLAAFDEAMEDEEEAQVLSAMVAEVATREEFDAWRKKTEALAAERNRGR